MSFLPDKRNGAPCATVDECTAPDQLSQSLWRWSQNLESLGLVLLIAILVVGVIVSVAAAAIARDNEVGIFLSSIVSWLIYAFIEYCIYKSISLLIGALAGIYQNTRASARLLEYQLRQQESASPAPQAGKAAPAAVPRQAPVQPKAEAPAPEEPVKPAPAAEGFVTCPKCGIEQYANRSICWNCGTKFTQDDPS